MLNIFVKIKPNSKENRVAGWLGDVVKIEIKAPAVDGKANKAMVDFLAEKIGISTRMIIIKAGWTNRQKMVEIKSDFTLGEIIEKIKSK
jgi:uncharacterized protein (TIGR00251 family)